MTGPQWIRPSVDEYEQLQERLSVALKALAAAEDKNATLIRDLELACRDLAAVKLSRDTAEAKLADAEKHADELAAHLRAINDKMWGDAEGELAWHDFQDLCEATEPTLAAHAARRAGKASGEREERCAGEGKR